MAKRKFDILVVGSGAGGSIVQRALESGASVALVDEGPIGGTCLNVGCIPSKMLIAAADRVVDIEEAGRFGIAASVERVDFNGLMAGVRRHVERQRRRIAVGIAATPRLTFYPMRGEFVDPSTLSVGSTTLRAGTIFLASGARPLVPGIPGLEDAGYLTNESLLGLEEPPKSMIVIGGGYIAVEYGHFFSAMGTAVTILQRGGRLLPQEEPEVSAVLEEELRERMAVHTGVDAVSAGRNGSGRFVIAEREDSKTAMRFEAETILVASGRRSNADLLHVERALVRTDERGYIEVDDYLQTSQKHIWAVGDANGKAMFRHAANVQASVAWHNAMHEKSSAVDHGIVPHAVFSRPQIASVGLTEARAREHHDVLVGMVPYGDTAKGHALREKRGFAKAIVERESQRLLGFHIVGPRASVLIQEVSNAMANGGAIDPIFRGYHIHPALSELITFTLSSVQ